MAMKRVQVEWFVVFLLVCFASSLYASSPRLINYQGRLSDSAGMPASGATVDFTFSFYGTESGSTPLYLSVIQEDVKVERGIYNVLIGSGTVAPGEENDLTSVFANHSEVWMGVKVGEDPEMTPRARIGAVPYALHATAPPQQGAVYRWNTFNTYAENSGWMMGADPAMFGGLHPGYWSNNSATAGQMSADKEVLRTLFTRKGYGGKNANVHGGVYLHRTGSSNNGQVVAALFRVKNTTGAPIDWEPYFYFTSYSSWSERASVALNGVNQWVDSSNCGVSCTESVTLSIPADRTSTAIFVSTAGPAYDLENNISVRPVQLGFFNDSLCLPPGLEFVDDLDKAAGGWEQ